MRSLGEEENDAASGFKRRQLSATYSFISIVNDSNTPRASRGALALYKSDF